MKAEIVGLEYVRGDYECVQSNSNKSPGYAGKLLKAGASRVSNRNNGWMDVTYPSRLILTVQVNGEENEIWLEHLFRRAIGRLSEKRREAIQNAMPKEVEVVEQVGRKGKKYFVLTEPELQAWLSRVKVSLQHTPMDGAY